MGWRYERILQGDPWAAEEFPGPSDVTASILQWISISNTPSTSANIKMDLLSYCNLNETKQLDYSSENPLNREPSAKDLIQQ